MTRLSASRRSCLATLQPRALPPPFRVHSAPAAVVERDGPSPPRPGAPPEPPPNRRIPRRKSLLSPLRPLHVAEDTGRSFRTKSKRASRQGPRGVLGTTWDKVNKVGTPPLDIGEHCLRLLSSGRVRWAGHLCPFPFPLPFPLLGASPGAAPYTRSPFLRAWNSLDPGLMPSSLAMTPHPLPLWVL